MIFLINGNLKRRVKYLMVELFCMGAEDIDDHRRKEGRKEGRKSLFGKVYINWWYLQYNNFSLGDHTKTAVRSLS